jgi:hypothetical protein
MSVEFLVMKLSSIPSNSHILSLRHVNLFNAMKLSMKLH